MTKPLTKTQLVAAVSESTGVDSKTVARVIDGLGETIQAEVVNGGGVVIPGIIKVVAKERAARTVRNPGTGETIDKPADRRVAATALKSLKDALAAS